MGNNNDPTVRSGQGNNFFGGFLLGIFVGGVIVFLLGTKKGKKLLKTISDEGIGDISGILEKANEVEDISADNEVNDEVKEENMGEDVIKKPVRRFFRGVSKRFN